MTGNTKVWRAPLAGLASVAMIATMGVAASTANAATDYKYPGVTVTLDANGGSFKNDYNDTSVNGGKATSSKDEKTVTLTDYQDQNVDGYSYADGVFPSLYDHFGADANIQWDAQQSRLFSGWYTEKQGGQAVDPTTALADGTTLYAHWSVGATGNSDESEYGVTLDTKGEVAYKDGVEPDGNADVIEAGSDANTYLVRLADHDTLADWELPQADAVVNNTVPSWDESAVSSAEAGVTLTVSTASGAKVTIKRAGADGKNYDIYKDGVLVNRTGDETFDVLAGSSLSEYQAVTSGTRHLLANGWKIWAGSAKDNKADYQWGTAFPAGNEFTLEPQGGFESVVVRVHKWTKDRVDLRYFVLSGSNFTKTFGEGFLGDVKRPNAQFKGWYDRDQKVTYTDGTEVTVKNDTFFTPNLIITNTTKADPVEFSFSKTLNHTDANIASNNSGIDLYAGYKNDARFTTITLDPNYSGADKISVKIYAGKKIGDQLPTVTRDGYTLEGWYTEPKDGFGVILRTDDKATTSPDYPAAGSTWYARWTADSKENTQKNGLLNNLSRFWYVDAGTQKIDGVSTHIAKISDGSSASFVKVVEQKDSEGKTYYKVDPSTGKYTEGNPGYVKTSYEKFVAARKSVLTDLKKELKLSKDADIATVYKNVELYLSAEKADTYNRKLANILVGEADFPDVNTSDTDSHTDSIQFMYNQGIVKGYADGTFGYGAPVARVDFIVWLYRAAGSPAVDSQASFTDVTAATVPNQEFRDAIAWAAANKITTGYADGTFAPYARIARQDAAAFIYRAAGSPNYIEDYNSKVFADVTPGDSANHSKAVLWANNNGVVKGFAGSVNRFAGLDTVARQDAAAFLARAIQANLL